MARAARRTCLLFIRLVVLGLAVALSGCDDSQPGATSRVVVFSDVHFNPFYDPALFRTLVDTPEERWAEVFATSPTTGPGTWGDETNYPLLVQSLDSIRDGGSTRLVIFGGDMLTHGFSSTFYALYGSQDVAAMRRFTLKTVSFFARQVRSRVGSTPVVFTLGNNDSYEGNYKIEPNGAFLADTAGPFLAQFLAGAADSGRFMQSYMAGGYYVAEPAGPGLVVVALNTIFLSPNAAAGIEGAVRAELDWLDATLAAARAAGKKVWIVMHIPPGADIFSTKGKVDAQGHINDAAMNWQPDPQLRFLQIMNAHRDVVAATFAGHTHVDEYRLPAGSLEISSSISPVYGNDPAYKTFTFADDSLSLTDYTTTNLRLGDARPVYEAYYTFSTAYPVSGPLDSALGSLFPMLRAAAQPQATYRQRYYAGHDAGSPITDANWPVYWCGIAKMARQDVVDCVNGY